MNYNAIQLKWKSKTYVVFSWCRWFLKIIKRIGRWRWIGWIKFNVQNISKNNRFNKKYLYICCNSFFLMKITYSFISRTRNLCLLYWFVFKNNSRFTSFLLLIFGTKNNNIKKHEELLKLKVINLRLQVCIGKLETEYFDAFRAVKEVDASPVEMSPLHQHQS